MKEERERGIDWTQSVLCLQSSQRLIEPVRLFLIHRVHLSDGDARLTDTTEPTQRGIGLKQFVFDGLCQYGAHGCLDESDGILAESGLTFGGQELPHVPPSKFPDFLTAKYRLDVSRE